MGHRESEGLGSCTSAGGSVVLICCEQRAVISTGRAASGSGLTGWRHAECSCMILMLGDQKIKVFGPKFGFRGSMVARLKLEESDKGAPSGVYNIHVMAINLVQERDCTAAQTPCLMIRHPPSQFSCLKLAGPV